MAKKIVKNWRIPLMYPEDLMKAVSANNVIALAPYFEGTFEKTLRNVGIGESHSYDCGGKMCVHIACDHNHQIIDARFKAWGCAQKYSYDGKPFPDDWIINYHIRSFVRDLITYSQYNLMKSEVNTISRKTYSRLLNKREDKIACPNLSNEALLLAIENYREKNRE